MLNQKRGNYDKIVTVCVMCVVRACVWVCVGLCVRVRVSDCLCSMHCFIPHPVTWRK